MTEQVNSKNIIFVPPAPEVLEKIARGVCQRLSESDPSCNEADIVYGFAEFLSATAKMHTNRLNSLQHSADMEQLDTDR